MRTDGRTDVRQYVYLRNLFECLYKNANANESGVCVVYDKEMSKFISDVKRE